MYGLAMDRVLPLCHHFHHRVNQPSPCTNTTFVNTGTPFTNNLITFHFIALRCFSLHRPRDSSSLVFRHDYLSVVLMCTPVLRLIHRDSLTPVLRSIRRDSLFIVHRIEV